MKNDDLLEPERHTHDVILTTKQGDEMELPAEIDGDIIYLLRNKAGVGAWHCQCVHKNDSCVKKITAITSASVKSA